MPVIVIPNINANNIVGRKKNPIISKVTQLAHTEQNISLSKVLLNAFKEVKKIKRQK